MVFDPKKHRDEFLFVPLGGSDEIGMNLNLYHYQGKWIMVDFGIGFADASWLPGVDVVVPNIEFLKSIKHDLLALILTHAHEDHVGAAPYYWNELDCPVYATPFTAAFLKAKLKGEGRPMKSKAVIKEVKTGAAMQLGPFSIEMIGLTHSIPEMQALAISTEKGTVMHTGDWKFDPDPLVGNASEAAKLKSYGDAGVLAMVCDSTNVFVEGHSGSEGQVRPHLTEVIKGIKGRVVVSTFASNVARLETIAEAAREAEREIILVGRSLWRILESAREAGYLEQYTFLPETEAGKIPRDSQLIICTGCQGEPFAALPKIARGDHQHVKLVPGDAVVFSARVIPGNEKRINHMQNALVRKGIELVVDHHHTIHVSGHPAREELAEMYRLVRPKLAVPVHGEARHIHEHAQFALSLQVPHAIEPYNGAVVRLSGEPSIVGQVESGYVAVDGGVLMNVESPVIKMRRRMMEAGVVIVSLAVEEDYTLVAAPSVTAPGSLDPETDAELIDSICEDLEDVMEGLPAKGLTDEKVRHAVRACIRRIFKDEVGKKPIIFVELLQVA